MMSEFFKKTLNLGFGALLLTEEKVEELIDVMAKNGNIDKEEAKAQVKKIFENIGSRKKEIEAKIEEIVEKILKRLEIPTRKEIQHLQAEIEELKKRLAEKEKTGTCNSEK